VTGRLGRIGKPMISNSIFSYLAYPAVHDPAYPVFTIVSFVISELAKNAKIMQEIYTSELKNRYLGRLKAPAVGRSKAYKYYNTGWLSIDPTPGL
jgi:hypothetical protein